MSASSSSTRLGGLVVVCLLAGQACESVEPAKHRNTVELLEASAHAAVQRNDVDAALELYDQLVMEARFPIVEAGAVPPNDAPDLVGRCRIEQARLCVVSGRFQRALHFADEALGDECITNLSPEQASTALALRAFARLRLGKPAEAWRDFEAAKRAAPGTPWVLAFQDAATGRGETLQQAREAIAGQRWAEALARLDDVVRMREDAEALTWRATVLDRLGRSPEAIADRRRLRELRHSGVQAVPAVLTTMPAAPAPVDAPPPDRRSSELLAALLAEAVGADEAATERFATRRAAYVARSGFEDLTDLEEGLEALFAGRSGAAEPAFTAVIVSQPQRAVAFHARALCRLQQGRLADGLADASQVVVLAPGNAAGWRLRSAVRACLQRLPEAINDLDHAIEIAPAAAAAWASRGHLHDLLGAEAAAVRDYRRALELGADADWVRLALARRILASERSAIHDPAQALGLAREVAGRSPRDPEALGVLAAALAASGDLPGAGQAVDEALQRCTDPVLRQELLADRAVYAAGGIRRDRRQGGAVPPAK